MANYPMSFSAHALGTSGLESSWSTTTADEREITCSIPAEFAGPNSGFSPEDLYLAALMNCYVATLKVIAANSKMSFASIDARATLTLDRDEPASTPWMKSAKLHFTATGVENEARFLRLMERVTKQCMIINSVKTDIEFDLQARGA